MRIAEEEGELSNSEIDILYIFYHCCKFIAIGVKLMYSCEQVHLLRLGERLIFFSSFTPSTPTSEKASHSYTKTARELIGGIHIRRGTAPPLVNSVTRQFSDLLQSVVTGGLVLDFTCTCCLGVYE